MASQEPIAPEDQFGRRVRAERTSRAWSQAELAEKLKAHGVDLHPTAIAKIEQRDADSPRSIRLNEAVALAKAFEMPLEHLLNSADELVAGSRERTIAALRLIEETANKLIDNLDDLRFARHLAGKEKTPRSFLMTYVHAVGIMNVAGGIEGAVRALDQGGPDRFEEHMAGIVKWLWISDDDEDAEDDVEAGESFGAALSGVNTSEEPGV